MYTYIAYVYVCLYACVHVYCVCVCVWNSKHSERPGLSLYIYVPFFCGVFNSARLLTYHRVNSVQYMQFPYSPPGLPLAAPVSGTLFSLSRCQSFVCCLVRSFVRSVVGLFVRSYVGSFVWLGGRLLSVCDTAACCDPLCINLSSTSALSVGVLISAFDFHPWWVFPFSLVPFACSVVTTLAHKYKQSSVPCRYAPKPFIHVSCHPV